MMHHKGEKKYQCSHCDKAFVLNSGLKDHIQRMHLGVKSNKCTHCTKSFFSSADLRIHTRTHTGEKPFECNFCDDNFRHKGGLSRHVKKEHVGSTFQIPLEPCCLIIKTDNANETNNTSAGTANQTDLTNATLLNLKTAKQDQVSGYQL